MSSLNETDRRYFSSVRRKNLVNARRRYEEEIDILIETGSKIRIALDRAGQSRKFYLESTTSILRECISYRRGLRYHELSRE